MNIRETYSECGHSKGLILSTRERRQTRCAQCRYDRGMAILGKGVLLLILGALLAAAILAWSVKAFGAESLEASMKRLPVYFEDRAEPELKAVQLADMATAIEQAATLHKPPGVGVKDWEALLALVAWHESTNSLRIHRGDCKPHECDGGRARGPWQQHRNGRSEKDWNALQGIENVTFQAETASIQLRRGFLACKGTKAPWLTATLNNYAGKACDAPAWPGRVDREETWTKIRRRL